MDTSTIALLAASIIIAVVPPAIVYSTYPGTAAYISATSPEKATAPGFLMGVEGCMGVASLHASIQGIFHYYRGPAGYLGTGNGRLLVVLHGCWKSGSGLVVDGARLAASLDGRTIVAEGSLHRTIHGTVLVPVEIHSGGQVYSRAPWSMCRGHWGHWWGRHCCSR